MTTQANATCGASTAGLLSATTGKVKMALLAIEELTREREQLSALTGAIRDRLAPRDEHSNPLDVNALRLCELLEDRLEDWGCLMAMRGVLDAAWADLEHTGTATEESRHGH